MGKPVAYMMGIVINRAFTIFSKESKLSLCDLRSINSDGKGLNFISILTFKLYRRKAKSADITSIENELSRGVISEEFVGLPISYVQKVEYCEDDNFLKLSSDMINVCNLDQATNIKSTSHSRSDRSDFYIIDLDVKS